MLEKFINIKGKPFLILFFSAISLGIFVVATLISPIIFKHCYSLIAGIVLMILAIPFHILGRKSTWFFVISFLLNSTATGFSVSAYYIQKNIPVDLYNMLLALIPAISILFLTYLTLQVFSKTKRFSISIACVAIFILLILAIVFWIRTSQILYSFAFFSLLITLFYICVFGISINHDERIVMRDISYGSFGSFIILTIVVIAILSEGDFLDSFDFGFDGKSKSK